MARPLEVPFIANVRDFLRGTDNISDALDDVADSLDDLSREAQRAGDDAGRALSDGIEDGARDAEKALDDVGKSDGLEKVGESAEDAAKEVDSAADEMEKSFKDAMDGVRKDGSDTGRKVGRDLDDGFDRAKRGADEFKQSASESAEEAASSFDGSADSIGDALQEISSEAFAGFGPAGAAAGLAAAAGIGLAIKAFQDGQMEAEEFRERVSEITGALNEIRSSGDSSLTLVRDRLTEMSEATTDADDNLAKIADSAREIEGIDFASLARGLAGDPEAAERNIEFLDGYIAKLEQTRPALNDLNSDEYSLHTSREERAQQLRDMLVEEQEARGQANENVRALVQAGIDDISREIAAHEERRDMLAQYAEETAQRQEAAAQGYADSIQDSYDQAGSATDQFVEDGIFNLGKYNAHMEESADAIRNYQQNIVASSSYLSEQALAYVRSLGPAAAPALQAFIDAPNDQKVRTASNWNTQGLIASSAYETALKSNLPETIDGPRVIAHADTSLAKQEIYRSLDGQTVWVNVRSRFVNQPV